MAEPGPRPNIVLEVADDLGDGDVDVDDSELIRTPFIDRLGATGVTLDNMYAPAVFDTPSRGGMLTGRHGARYRLPESVTPAQPDGLPADATTVASCCGMPAVPRACSGSGGWAPSPVRLRSMRHLERTIYKVSYCLVRCDRIIAA